MPGTLAATHSHTGFSLMVWAGRLLDLCNRFCRETMRRPAESRACCSRVYSLPSWLGTSLRQQCGRAPKPETRQRRPKRLFVLNLQLPACSKQHCRTPRVPAVPSIAQNPPPPDLPTADAAAASALPCTPETLLAISPKLLFAKARKASFQLHQYRNSIEPQAAQS